MAINAKRETIPSLDKNDSASTNFRFVYNRKENPLLFSHFGLSERISEETRMRPARAADGNQNSIPVNQSRSGIASIEMKCLQSQRQSILIVCRLSRVSCHKCDLFQLIRSVCDAAPPLNVWIGKINIEFPVNAVFPLILPRCPRSVCI